MSRSVTEDLHRQVAAHAGEHLRHAHFDRLGEAVGDAREVLHHLAQLVGEPFLVRLAPFGTRLEHQEGIGLVQPHRVETEFVGTGARDDAFHFRHPRHDGLLHAQVECRTVCSRLIEGSFSQLHDDVAFVHHRHEGFADQGVYPGRSDQRDKRRDHSPACV